MSYNYFNLQKCLNMLIDHVVPSISNPSSGPSQSIPLICDQLIRCGTKIALHTLLPLPNIFYNFQIFGYEKNIIPHPALGVSPKMYIALTKRAKVIDIIHNHSLWMMPNIYAGKAVRNTNCKLVLSPHGTMTNYAWTRSRWKKKIIYFLGQKSSIIRTDLFHATSSDELLCIRRLGWRQPVAVIPNGINLTNINTKENVVKDNSGKRILLFLSRIHPTKQISLLLKVWQSLEKKHANWDLWICGPLQGQYPQEMIKLSKHLNLHRAFFKGEAVGNEKYKFYNDADLFVLPTQSENFGMVVAEALSSGLPAVVTKGAPWRGLEIENCGWWIDNDEKILHDTLSTAMSLTREILFYMGQNGRRWMERDYYIEKIAIKMRIAYEWLLHGGNKPDFIFID